MSGEEYRVDLLVEAARMYYENSLTHAEIGKKLGFSRWTASRLIQEARDRGIVRITIEPPQAEHYQLEQALKEYFDLDKVIVFRKKPEKTLHFAQWLELQPGICSRYVRSREPWLFLGGRRLPGWPGSFRINGLGALP